MRKGAILFISVLMVFAFVCGCDRGNENVSLAPHLYEDGYTISPNPISAFKTATIFFPYSDHDGDIKDSTVFIRLESDAGDVYQLSPNEGSFKVWGGTDGAMSFELDIKSVSESQGTYYIYIVDEAGNRSNEISDYLAVNPPAEE